MIHRRYQHAATASAVLLAAAGVGSAAHRLYPHAALLGLGVLVCTEAALREQRRHRRLEAERAWVRRRHTLYCPHPGPLTPCCRLHENSYGQVHDARCTRAGQPGPPCDEAFLAHHRARFERLVAGLPIPDTAPHDKDTTRS
ncbi:hypothetical protein [Streptomyces hirsutus]|uniref:hypothetical protein n=1 Tax=Streptomyces hirsutus TaxID=35620 RepID=UPI00367523B7